MVMNRIQLVYLNISDTFPCRFKKKLTKSLATPNFSFKTWARGLISMYSFTASYNAFKLASLQNNSGTSKTFETRLTSRRSLNKRPVNLSASCLRRRRAPDSASCLGMDNVSGEDSTRCALVS
jgi:hypothetical protein